MSTTALRATGGDANSLHQYAASLKKAANDLRFQLQLANQPVRTYLGKQEGDWKNQFKDTWNKISPDFDALSCPISPSLGQQVYDQLAGTSRWLESYAHEIDVEMANAQKAGVTALSFVGGIVVLGAVSLATAGWGTVPTAVALVGAATGYGILSFAAVDYFDQVIDNSVRHDPSPWTDIDFSKVIAEGIKGGVVGLVTMAVALPLAGLLRVLGPVLSTGIAFSAGSTLGDVTGQLVVDHQVNPIEVGAAAVTGLVVGSLGGAVGAARTVPSAEIGETPSASTTPTLVRGQTELPGGQGVDAQPIVVNGPRGYQVGVQVTFKTPLELPIDGQMVRFPAGTQVVFVPGESPTSGTGWFTVPGARGTPTTSFGFQTGGPGGSGLTFLGSTSAPPGPGTSQPTWTPTDGQPGPRVPGPSGGRTVELAPSATVTAQGRPYRVANLETGAVTVYGLNDSPITITPMAKTPPTVGGQVAIREIPTTEPVWSWSGSAASQPLRTVPPNGVSAVDAVVPPGTGTAPARLRVVPGLASEAGPLIVAPPSFAQPQVLTAVVQTPAGAAASPTSGPRVPSTVSPPDSPAPSQPVHRPVVTPLPGVVSSGQQVPARQPVSLPDAQVVNPGPLQAELGAPTPTGADTIYALAFGEDQQVTAVILDSPTGTAKQVAVQVLSQPRTAFRILDGPGVTVTASELAMSPDVIAVKFTVATDGTVTVLEHWTGAGQQVPSQVPRPVTTLTGPLTWLTTPQTWLTVPDGHEVPAPVPLSVPLPWGPPSRTPPPPTAPPAPRPPSDVPPPVTTVPLPPAVEVNSNLPAEVPALSTQSMVAQPHSWVETRFPSEFQPWRSSQTVPPPQPPTVFTWDAPDPDPARITGRGPDGQTLFSGRLNHDGTITMDGGGVGTFVKDPDATSFDDGLGLAVQLDGDSEVPVPQGGAGVVDADPEAGLGGYTINLNGGSIQVGDRTIPIGGPRPDAAGHQPVPETSAPLPAGENGASDVVVSLPNGHAAASSQAQARQPSWPQLIWGVPQFFAQMGGQQMQPQQPQQRSPEQVKKEIRQARRRLRAADRKLENLMVPRSTPLIWGAGLAVGVPVAVLLHPLAGIGAGVAAGAFTARVSLRRWAMQRQQKEEQALEKWSRAFERLNELDSELDSLQGAQWPVAPTADDPDWESAVELLMGGGLSQAPFLGKWAAEVGPKTKRLSANQVRELTDNSVRTPTRFSGLKPETWVWWQWEATGEPTPTLAGLRMPKFNFPIHQTLWKPKEYTAKPPSGQRTWWRKAKYTELSEFEHAQWRVEAVGVAGSVAQLIIPLDGPTVHQSAFQLTVRLPDARQVKWFVERLRTQFPEWKLVLGKVTLADGTRRSFVGVVPGKPLGYPLPDRVDDWYQLVGGGVGLLGGAVGPVQQVPKPIDWRLEPMTASRIEGGVTKDQFRVRLDQTLWGFPGLPVAPIGTVLLPWGVHGEVQLAPAVAPLFYKRMEWRWKETVRKPPPWWWWPLRAWRGAAEGGIAGVLAGHALGPWWGLAVGAGLGVPQAVLDLARERWPGVADGYSQSAAFGTLMAGLAAPALGVPGAVASGALVAGKLATDKTQPKPGSWLDQAKGMWDMAFPGLMVGVPAAALSGPIAGIGAGLAAAAFTSRALLSPEAVELVRVLQDVSRIPDDADVDMLDQAYHQLSQATNSVEQRSQEKETLLNLADGRERLVALVSDADDVLHDLGWDILEKALPAETDRYLESLDAMDDQVEVVAERTRVLQEALQALKDARKQQPGQDMTSLEQTAGQARTDLEQAFGVAETRADELLEAFDELGNALQQRGLDEAYQPVLDDVFDPLAAAYEVLKDAGTVLGRQPPSPPPGP